MEGSYFPEDKDLAHKIMMDLSNADLVKICATNKRLHDICNNYPSFWRNRFIKDYGEHAAKYKPENRSWKNHYMTVFIDLQKYKNDPMKFLENIAWKDNVENSFFIDSQNKKLIPLNDAPEWVTNNLYLLKLDVEIRDLNQAPGNFTKYKNITPIDLLQKQIQTTEYINGFIHIGKWDRFRPYYNDMRTINVSLNLF